MKRILAISVLAALAAGLTLLMIYLYQYVPLAFFLLVGVVAGLVVAFLFIWALDELGWL